MKAEFRSNRTRAKIHGTADRPRLSVNISNMHVTAQIIDDDKGATLAYATTVGTKQKGSKSELAAFVGSEIAKKAKKAKIEKSVAKSQRKQRKPRSRRLFSTVAHAFMLVA